MSTDNKPQIIKRVEALEGRYTDVGLNTETFPISDAVNSSRSDVAASSKAVKTAYDDGTRYATTTQQGQVILTHDVDGGAQDRALTPFGAREALGELSERMDGLESSLKGLEASLGDLESSLLERIEQLVGDMENKLNGLNSMIGGVKSPMFDMEQTLVPTDSSLVGNSKFIFPQSASLWFWKSDAIASVPDFGGDEPKTFTYQKSCGFAGGGETKMLPAISLTIWRVFP